MSRKLAAIACLFIVSIVSNTVESMTIKRDGLITLTISGAINPGDEKNFESNVGRGMALRVELDSSGGDVETALKIGRIIRKNKLHTVVTGEAECASACVFLLLGGVRRGGEGRIGLHRPYFGTLPASATQQDVLSANKELSIKVEAYLSEMNLGIEILSAMRAIPPNSMRWLTQQEAKNYGIFGIDVVYDELAVAKNAEIYGVKGAEYRASAAAAISACKTAGETLADPLMPCFAMSMYGLTRSEYDRISATALKMRRKCVAGHDCYVALHQCLRRLIPAETANCSN